MPEIPRNFDNVDPQDNIDLEGNQDFGMEIMPFEEELDEITRGRREFGADQNDDKIKLESWKQVDFALDKELKNRKGIFVEVAGPTKNGYEQVNFNKLDRRVYVSNVVVGGHKNSKPKKHSPEIIPDDGKIDFVADAEHLPFGDEKLGALFASCLVKENRQGAISEAFRTLEPGGIFIYQRCQEGDIEQARELGFNIREYIKRKFPADPSTPKPSYWFSVIFQKPKPKPR